MSQTKSNLAHLVQSGEKELIERVDTFFDQNTLTSYIETLAAMKTSLCNDTFSSEKDKAVWDKEFTIDTMHICMEIELFLCKLYELRAPHLYREANQEADQVLS